MRKLKLCTVVVTEMKAKWRSFLFVGLVFLMVSSVIGCATTSTTSGVNGSELPQPSEEQQAIDELRDSLGKYILELTLAEDIAKEGMNETAELLHAGKINTLEFRKRIYEIILIQANTFKYIDSKPEYAILNSLMWMQFDGKPPNLGRCIPELESDSEKAEVQYQEYLEDYIALHWIKVEEFTQDLREYEQDKH